MNTAINVKISDYIKHFKYMIYDGYRSKNLAHTRDYINFLIKTGQDDSQIDEDSTPDHILQYLSKDLDTRLPAHINETKILTFDQNFECGNLDSVYLESMFSYNLLMKVDTNTKGNTYWFYFRVSDFQVDRTYTFNIMNFSRNLDKFYNNDMNIVVKTENSNKKSEWRYN